MRYILSVVLVFMLYGCPPVDPIDECAPGCEDAMIGNGECDPECDVAECEYDFADCDWRPTTTSIIVTTTTVVPTTTVPSTTTSMVRPMWYCETAYDLDRCNDGSYIKVCVANDLSRCGYEVKGQNFYCAACYPVLICYDAAGDAVWECYYASQARVEAYDVDEVIEDMQTQVEEYLDALEEYSETF